MAFDPRELAQGILEEFASSAQRPHRYERLDRVFRRTGELSGKPWERGEGNINAELTADDVAEILSSTCSDDWLAERYAVSVWTIKAARRRLTWKHVKAPTPSQMTLIATEED